MQVGRCRSKPVEPRVEIAWLERLKVKIVLNYFQILLPSSTCDATSRRCWAWLTCTPRRSSTATSR